MGDPGDLNRGLSPSPGPRIPDPGSPDPGPRIPDPVFLEEPPPFGRSWNTLYAGVAATLTALIVLFYAFTQAFR